MTLTALRRHLPNGDTLPADSWARRHRALVGLLWCHVGIVTLFGAGRGVGAVQALLEGGLPVAGFALAAGVARLGPRLRAVLVTIGLVFSSIVLVHFSDGLIEMHFHFFLVVVVVSLYQSWRPFLAALAVVLLHHGVFGMLAPELVYNHPQALQAPWVFALLHSSFILVVSAACLVSWRLNEDVLDKERGARRTLSEVTDALHRAQELAEMGTWRWNLLTNEVVWSEQLQRIFGLDADAIVDRDRFIALVHPEDRRRVAGLLQAPLVGDGLDFECRVVRPDGSERVVHALGHPVEQADAAASMIGTCQDVTQRRRLEREVEWRAFHDQLTGLANRALFLDRLEHALVRRPEQRQGVVAVLFLDLDGFKSVNDRLGHRAGDELLIEVGRRLTRSCRRSDTVARFGGDEFAVVCDGVGPRALGRVTDRIVHELSQPLEISGECLPVACSIGVATSADAPTPHNADQLLQYADLAMYAAKRRGRGMERFHPELVADERSRNDRVRELDRALEDAQFVVHYQPIVDLRTRVVDGIEALVRWNHPTRGLLPPVEFIQLAEDSGRIVALGAWVLSEATSRAAELRDAWGRRLHLNVNVAAEQLSPALVGVLTDALATSGFAAEDLTLEITESCLVGDVDAAVAVLDSLRALGVRIALDDFGSGYSSFAHLARLPVDVLKIDREFVSPITADAGSVALAETIVRLAAIFGLATVAEGIETGTQEAALRGLGCDHGQGFLYSRPRPIEQLLNEGPLLASPLPPGAITSPSAQSPPPGSTRPRHPTAAAVD